MKIILTKIDNNFDEKLFNELLGYVDIEKVNRIKRFIKKEDSLRTLFGDILARYYICSELNIRNSEISFHTNKYGKPFIKNNQLYFNVSHSGEWVALVIGRSISGIDIQELKQVNLDIAKRYFSEYEYNELIKLEEKRRLSYFYDLWTLKESFIKAEGKGLTIPLNSFYFKINSKISLINNYSEKNYYFKKYEIENNYKLSVCSGKDSFPENYNIIDFNIIAKDFKKYC